MILILGGTATYHLNLHDELGPLERVDLDTPYGAAFPIFRCTGRSEGTGRIAIASRHGVQRLEVTPPFVNARANIWAAHTLGVRAILSWNGVGAINALLEVDDLLVLDGLLDFTKTRPRSFQGDARSNVSTPFSLGSARSEVLTPFSSYLRSLLYGAARAVTERAFPCGVYACSEGPRLETAAEIQAFKRLGADVVGMTLVPEVFLAHELGISFASLAYVTNYATGVEPATGAPRHFDVEVAQRCLAVVRSAVALLATST